MQDGSYRSQKGTSVLTFPSQYVVIDLETTGYDPARDRIIELGAVRYQNGGKVAEFETLVNPQCEIDEFITHKTGISNEMVKTSPLLCDVLKDYIEFIGKDIVVGHNVHFDINFIYDNLVSLFDIPFVNDYCDTLFISRRVLPEIENHKLITLMSYFNFGERQEHRSISDCENTNSIFVALHQLIRKRNIDVLALAKHTPAFHRPYKMSGIDVDSLTIDEDCLIYGKVCVFTGTLEKMGRKEAERIVEKIGGICGKNVTKDTNFLILGNNDYCPTIKDGKSSKQKKAEALQSSGQDIEIISESVFYDLIYQ